MKLDVTINEDDCREGCRGTERYCVVSTAIARLVPDANRIETNVHTIRFTLKGADGKTRRYVYRTPELVREYVIGFDAGQEAKPMHFVLDNPQIAEKTPTPRGKAKTPSFKAQASAKTRRSIRVFGEKAFVGGIR